MSVNIICLWFEIFKSVNPTLETSLVFAHFVCEYRFLTTKKKNPCWNMYKPKNYIKKWRLHKFHQRLIKNEGYYFWSICMQKIKVVRSKTNLSKVLCYLRIISLSVRPSGYKIYCGTPFTDRSQYLIPDLLVNPRMWTTDRIIISSCSIKWAPRVICLSLANAGYGHMICRDISSFLPHFLHSIVGLNHILCMW